MDFRDCEKRNRYMGRTIILFIIPIIIGMVATGGASADLPGGEELMKKTIEALGGEDAIARHHNSLMRGKMTISGIELDMTIYSAEPALQYSLLESAMIGKMESGCNGEVAWDLSVMQGASVKEGKELEKALFNATFNSELLWRDRYTSIDVQAVEEVEGTPCYRVVLVPTVGDSVTAYIDTESWLTVKTVTVDNSPTGSVSVVSHLSDYREVDGVKTPFRMKILLMGAQEMITTKESIEYNVDIPEGTFDVPEEIQEILDAGKQAGEE